MKVFCLCFGIMIGMLGIWVEVGTAQSNWMPDANLRAGVRKALGKNPGDTFTQAEMATITELIATAFSNVYNIKGVTDLTGLEHATSLTTLRFDSFPGHPNDTDHSISTIPDLSVLNQLTFFTIQYDDLMAFPMLPSGLTTLALAFNDITNLMILLMFLLCRTTPVYKGCISVVIRLTRQPLICRTTPV